MINHNKIYKYIYIYRIYINMLTNFELLDIAGRMNIDCIDGYYYKDELVLHRLTPNKAYVIN